jgi:hypothetical protein
VREMRGFRYFGNYRAQSERSEAEHMLELLAIKLAEVGRLDKW